jgi:hemoglobin
MKKDISTKQDIELLVNSFYDKVRNNKIIGYIFNDIAKVNWESHLPKMYAFWSGLLLGETGFSGNPMQKHIALSKIAPMTEIEFAEWLRLFILNTDELFEGPKTEEAKERAGNIARLMLHKIESQMD